MSSKVTNIDVAGFGGSGDDCENPWSVHPSTDFLVGEETVTVISVSPLLAHIKDICMVERG